MPSWRIVPNAAAAAPADHADATARTRAFSSLCLKVPWDSKHREIVWKLVHNDLPLSDRMSGTHARPCACGCELPGRAHCFWDCPHVLSLRNFIRSRLMAAAPSGQTVSLRCHHIWLGACPLPDLHPGAWCIVCIAALHAMDSVRRTITRLSISAAAASGGGTITAARLRTIRTQLLHAFASHQCPTSWREAAAPFRRRTRSSPPFLPTPLSRLHLRSRSCWVVLKCADVSIGLL
jgi:hypothetical protein